MEWMKKFQRESEMWLMFTEYWKLVQKYWNVEDVDEYWDCLIRDCDSSFTSTMQVSPQVLSGHILTSRSGNVKVLQAIKKTGDEITWLSA